MGTRRKFKGKRIRRFTDDVLSKELRASIFAMVKKTNDEVNKKVLEAKKISTD